MAADDPRLRGQEVDLRLFVDNVLEDSIVLFASFEETMKFEKKEDGFLGETTNRYDHIFNGVDAKSEFQVNSVAWESFQDAIKAQAQRKTPASRIDLIVTDFYASGETSIKTYPNIKFGPSTRSTPGRGEFVKVTLDFSTGDRDVQHTTAI